jgi:hypothetical protein
MMNERFQHFGLTGDPNNTRQRAEQLNNLLEGNYAELHRLPSFYQNNMNVLRRWFMNIPSQKNIYMSLLNRIQVETRLMNTFGTLEPPVQAPRFVAASTFLTFTMIPIHINRSRRFQFRMMVERVNQGTGDIFRDDNGETIMESRGERDGIYVPTGPPDLPVGNNYFVDYDPAIATRGW